MTIETSAGGGRGSCPPARRPLAAGRLTWPIGPGPDRRRPPGLSRPGCAASSSARPTSSSSARPRTARPRWPSPPSATRRSSSDGLRMPEMSGIEATERSSAPIRPSASSVLTMSGGRRSRCSPRCALVPRRIPKDADAEESARGDPGGGPWRGDLRRVDRDAPDVVLLAGGARSAAALPGAHRTRAPEILGADPPPAGRTPRSASGSRDRPKDRPQPRLPTS